MDSLDRFSMVIASDADHEKVVAEIYVDGEFALLVSQEGNEGKFCIETPGPGLDESAITHVFDLEGMIRMLELARIKLMGSDGT